MATAPSSCMKLYLVDREAIVLEVAALLVQRMARLVDGARQALGQIALLEACCHAHVRRVRPCSTRSPTCSQLGHALGTGQYLRQEAMPGYHSRGGDTNSVKLAGTANKALVAFLAPQSHDGNPCNSMLHTATKCPTTCQAQPCPTDGVPGSACTTIRMWPAFSVFIARPLGRVTTFPPKMR